MPSPGVVTGAARLERCLNLTNSTYEPAYDDNLVNPGPAPRTGADNVTGSSSGDLFVAEDGGNMES